MTKQKIVNMKWIIDGAAVKLLYDAATSYNFTESLFSFICEDTSWIFEQLPTVEKINFRQKNGPLRASVALMYM